MNGFMKFFIGFFVFVYGTLVTAIVMGLASYQPPSFVHVVFPWFFVGGFVMLLPKKIGGYILAVCHITMVGSLLVGMFFVSVNVVDYFNEVPEKECNFDCPQPLPDTSDLIVSVTPTGDNNYSPGYHGVSGHYRGGQYIQPYIRSNPDGNPYNNLND